MPNQNLTLLTNQRLHQRFDLQLQASIWELQEPKDQNLLQATTRDISSGGAFFMSGGESSFAEGSEIKMELVIPFDKLTTPKGKQVHILLTGCVVRQDKQGIGISFDENFEFINQETEKNIH